MRLAEERIGSEEITDYPRMLLNLQGVAESQDIVPPIVGDGALVHPKVESRPEGHR
jgi:hypothetical protein